jgi:RNA polymerase sigma-70 factor (ECF subfamily)
MASGRQQYDRHGGATSAKRETQQVPPNPDLPSPDKPGTELDDSELLRRGERGDQAAFRALLNRHARYLYGIAHSLTGNSADAEDIVQETLVGAITGHFRGESSVRTWLVRILVNRAAMLRRSAIRKSGTVPLNENELESKTAASAGSPASAGASSIDAKADLTTMLKTLSPEHREVIVLRELQGLSYEEMAGALGVPRGTVESRLHRAREELRKRFRGY